MEDEQRKQQEALKDLFGSDSNDDAGSKDTEKPSDGQKDGAEMVKTQEEEEDVNVDMRDLFGSDEEEVGEGERKEESQGAEKRDGDAELRLREQGEAEEEEEERVNEPLFVNVEMRDGLVPKTLTLAKLPNSLDIQPEVYRPSDVEDGYDVPMIRWRFRNGEIESNARIVTWSDGSRTLSVGKDMFQVKDINVGNENSYLYVRHGQGLVQCQGKLNSKIVLNPIGISKKDRPRARTLRHVQHKVKVKQTATLVDPVREREEKEKAEEARIRDKEKLADKQKQHMKRSMMQARAPPQREHYLSAAFLEEDDELDALRHEEDDDGFIVSDEDMDDDDIVDADAEEAMDDPMQERGDIDDEEGARRLSAIKSAPDGVAETEGNPNQTKGTEVGLVNDSDGEELAQKELPKKRTVVMDSDSE